MGEAEIRSESDVPRERTKRLFKFLQEFHQLRHPAKRQVDEQPWRFWLRDLPDHPTVRPSRTLTACLQAKELAAAPKSEGYEAEGEENEPILRVRRPESKPVPRPPELLKEWLETGWGDPYTEVRVRDCIERPVPAQEWNEGTQDEPTTKKEFFADDPARPEALAAWQPLRDEWARTERSAPAAARLFDSLYEVHRQIERESERFELILGDGIAAWRLPTGGVYHPVLLQRVELQFDAEIPEFKVVETEAPVELYTAVLRAAPGVEPGALAKARTELEEGGFDPLGGEETEKFLRRLVQTLSPRGRYEARGVPTYETNDPTIGRSPVLFLRERTLGFAGAVEAILEDLENGTELPGFIQSVVGWHNSDTDETSTAITTQRPMDILFSKQWNQEQILIANRLERNKAVIVQGPPGTGKTHTIANLIGHLLANGQSVLVTAHTIKALRVLREKVVAPLQPLCVSVLESDLESRRQLEDSVNRIAERLSCSNAEQLHSEAQQLRQERSRILERLCELREQLLEARSAEYREIVVQGQTFTPAEAARKVAREREQHGWLPGPLERGAVLPLTVGELSDLYASNGALSVDEERQLLFPLPDPDELPVPQEFRRLLKERAELEQMDRSYRAELWQGEVSPGIAELERVQAELVATVEMVQKAEPWQLAVYWAGFKGAGHREAWEQLLEVIRVAEERAAAAAASWVRLKPELPADGSLAEQAGIVEQILGAIGTSQRLSRVATFMHPAWGRFCRAVRVGGRVPSTAEDFQALREVIALELARRELLTRWEGLVSAAGGPSAEVLGAQPEQAAAQFVHFIKQWLDWRAQRLEPAVERLKACGFRWEDFLAGEPPELRPQGELLRLIRAAAETLSPILASRCAAARWQDVTARLTALKEGLSRAMAVASSSQVVRRLAQAAADGDPVAYEEAYQCLVQLFSLQEWTKRRHALLSRLEKAAPGWASAIRERVGVHGGTTLPGDPHAAWLWRQLDQELDARAAVSLQALQDERAGLTERLYRVTADLVERLAWAHQIERTTQAQKQALIGWLNFFKRIGKGYSKRAPKLRAEAAKTMTQARAAVPVWIMPLARVFDQFDPRSTRFDVVIIDEASQSDVTALVALYLGKRVIVVGDNEQVSPEAVGQQVNEIEPLIQEYLRGLPNAELYDGRRSIYDIAWESFGGGVVLLEHFRSVPEIIQFSNDLCYNGRIKPLRESNSVDLRPAVVAYRVQGSSTGRVNREEARTIASLLVATCRRPEYRKKSFGIISLVGEEQAIEIDRLLRQYLPPNEYQHHQVLCGTAAQFQGDERDVVFLSMVDSSADGRPLALRQDDRFKQRFNVAASRAKDQLWLVYSLDPQGDLKQGDLRRRLIEYACDPMAAQRVLERELRRAESEFEKEVLRRLVARNYRVRSQWPVGYYRIDLVVEGGGKRLAVECDGDRYHPLEKLEEDMARQAILERLGWRFVRIRGSAFFRNPDKALQEVFDKLEAMGIPPEGAQETRAAEDQAPLVEEVKRAAAELQRQWSEREGDRTLPEQKPLAGQNQALRATATREK